MIRSLLVPSFFVAQFGSIKNHRTIKFLIKLTMITKKRHNTLYKDCARLLNNVITLVECL